MVGVGGRETQRIRQAKKGRGGYAFLPTSYGHEKKG